MFSGWREKTRAQVKKELPTLNPKPTKEAESPGQEEEHESGKPSGKAILQRPIAQVKKNSNNPEPQQ